MATVLGAHVTQGSRDGYGLVAPHCRGVVSLVGGAFDEVHEDTYRVYRPVNVYGEGHTDIMPGFNDLTVGDMGEQAAYWWPKIRAQTEREQGFHGRIDAIQATNEVGGNDVGEIAKLIAYEKVLVTLAAADGWTLLIGNFATNSPHWEIWVEHVAPFIRWAWERGHIYSRHAYFDAHPPADNQERPFKELGYLGNGGPVILTEVGFVNFPGPDAFMDAIKTYDERIQQYPNVGFGAIFTYGDWQGPSNNANIEDASSRLAAYLETNPFQKWTPTHQESPPEEPPMPEKHKAIVVKLPQDMTQTEWLEAAQTAYKFRHTMTASHDDTLTVLRGGNEESFVKFSHPERDVETMRLVKEAGYAAEPLYPDTQQPDHFDVIPYSQRDPRWAAERLGGEGSTETIGGWGCLMVAYCIHANFWGLTDDDPSDFNRRMTAAGAMYKQFTQPAALRTTFPDQVIYDGFKQLTDSRMEPQIRDWIDNGRPVPARVDFKPATSQWEQHWILIIGYTADGDYIMADPWTGLIGTVADVYGIAGTDILEALFYRLREEDPQPTPPGTLVDLLPWVMGTDRVQFDMEYVVDGRSGTQTTQVRHFGNFWLYVKGENGEYERLGIEKIDGTEWICRYEDTSEAPDRFYAHYRQKGGLIGAPWVPRYMHVGETAETHKFVQHYRQADCAPLDSGTVTDRITLLHEPRPYEFKSGKVLDVVTLRWGGGEVYRFAKQFGNVGFLDENRHFWFMEGPLGGRKDKTFIKPDCLDLGW